MTNHGDAGRVVNGKSSDFTLANVRSLLNNAHFVIGNVECPITDLNDEALRTYLKTLPRQGHIPKWSYSMVPEMAGVLRSADFSAVGFANNHAFDRGTIGLTDSFLHLQKAGIRTFGAGRNESEARRPLIIDTPFGKVGVVNVYRPRTAFTTMMVADAGRESLGINYLSNASIVQGAEEAKRLGAKWLVGYVHWGKNYEGVQADQRQVAGLFSEAGYDLVVGHHSHTVGSVERIGKTLVLYSLGNFVFSTKGRFWKMTDVPAHGLIARTYLGPAGFEGVELTCLSVDNTVVNYQPRSCTAAQQERVFASLGPAVRVQNGLGVIRMSPPTLAQQHEHAVPPGARRRRRRSEPSS